MSIQVRIVLHRFDDVVRMSVSFIIQTLVLLIFSNWPIRGLLYPCLSEIMRGSLIGPCTADIEPRNGDR